MTVIAFPSVNSSEAYYERLVAGLGELSGYSDASSSLGQFQQYGSCHAYSEDVEWVAVAYGICSKGNLILEDHLVSSVALEQLEQEMESLVGSMYNSAG